MDWRSFVDVFLFLQEPAPTSSIADGMSMAMETVISCRGSCRALQAVKAWVSYYRWDIVYTVRHVPINP